MAILRESWSGEVNDEQVLSTYQYVIKLRERLEQTCQLACENLEKVQFMQKTYLDKRARSRRFEVGDKSCYYSQQRVISCSSNGKVGMKWLK